MVFNVPIFKNVKNLSFNNIALYVDIMKQGDAHVLGELPCIYTIESYTEKNYCNIIVKQII